MKQHGMKLNSDAASILKCDMFVDSNEIIKFLNLSRTIL